MATCCLLFVLHSYQELDKYFAGMTSMAMRTETDPNLPFPTIVICLQDPYKKDKYPATSEEYRNLTYSLDEIIDTNKTIPNIRQGLIAEEMATYFSGRCFILKIPENYTFPDYVSIALKMNKILHVYFVDKGQELCILYGSQCGKNVRNGRFVVQEKHGVASIIVRLTVEKRALPDG